MGNPIDNLKHENMRILFKHFLCIAANTLCTKIIGDTNHGGKAFQDRFNDMNPFIGLLIAQIGILRKERFRSLQIMHDNPRHHSDKKNQPDDDYRLVNIPLLM